MESNQALAKRDMAKGDGLVVLDLEDPVVVERLAHGIAVVPGQVCVFSDEWAQRPGACAAFARAQAGAFARRIGARRCAVREVERGVARAFLEQFHIQGWTRRALVALGLFLEAELLGVLTLGRHHRQGHAGQVVLDRLCFREGVQVVGGASRLLDQARQWAIGQGYSAMVSFSDNRLTAGRVYERLGFAVDVRYRPDYFYVQDGRRVSKQSQQKRCTGCPPEVTELSWAQQRGMVRCYDAGKVRWVLPLQPAGQTRQQANSEQAARSNAAGRSGGGVHMRGHFRSRKAGGEVFFASSYELRCMFELEGDPAVRSFRRCEAIQVKGGRWRNPDLWVELANGRSEIWEVKPAVLVDAPRARAQIADVAVYAAVRGVGFRVWTEQDSALKTDGRIIGWAREYLDRQQADGAQHVARAQQQRKAIRQRRYAKDQAASVTVACAYCGVDHVVLPRTYARNVAKHEGAYVCEALAGHIGGSKPKLALRKENPYAAEGKKACSMCQQVLPVGEFQQRRASWDGLSAACKPCLRVYDAARYRARVDKAASRGQPEQEGGPDGVLQ